MQVYERLPLITNKHPVEERGGIPHHVMDHIGWKDEYYIHRYSDEANAIIGEIHERGKIPIIIGGTHYYLQNLLFANKTVGEIEDNFEKRALSAEERELLDGPVEPIFKRLQSLDPIISQKFHPRDKRKLRRALEIFLTTGQKASDLYKEQKFEELEDSSLKYNSLFFWVYCDPEVLKLRLDDRVDAMLENGALDEIKELYSYFCMQLPSPDTTRGIWQVIGFKEFLPWLETGQVDQKAFSESVERMKVHTRQYAKYQVKWIKKLLGVELNKEARFNFKYGGKMYLLDSSDLANWKSSVSERGTAIAGQFLHNGPRGVKEPQAPQELQELIPDEKFFDSFNSNKTINSEKNWEHFQCPHCKDANGNPVVTVGKESWEIHVLSRRHKRLSPERKRKHEEMIAKFKKQKDEGHQRCV